jgi:FMN phosphatase YigB (HAD superfamily)
MRAADVQDGPMESAQALLLDVGVVLFKSAWEIADDYERLRGLPAGTVVGRGPLEWTAPDETWERYRKGEITERDYWLTFADTAVANGAPLDGHPHLMRAMFQQPGVEPERPEAMALIAECMAAGKGLGILSNELMDFQGREWVEARPWFDDFPVLIDSSELGIRKPDPQPYLVAAIGLGLPPDAIVFIDDNPAYVEGGLAVGMRSILLDVLDPAAAFDAARAELGL